MIIIDCFINLISNEQKETTKLYLESQLWESNRDNHNQQNE